MWITEHEMGRNVRKICEDETCTIFKVQGKGGEGMMTVYPVFKGCCLIYNDFHMERCDSGFQPRRQIFCIDHCREGRIEWAVDQNRYIYVEGGDMQVNSREHHCTDFVFPLCHYHGLTISFDVEEIRDELLHIMEGFSVDVIRLREKFCPDDRTFIMRAGVQVDKVKDIVALLTDDLEHWYTLEELSERFSFPQTSLKQCFKGIYGRFPLIPHE